MYKGKGGKEMSEIKLGEEAFIEAKGYDASDLLNLKIERRLCLVWDSLMTRVHPLLITR